MTPMVSIRTAFALKNRIKRKSPVAGYIRKRLSATSYNYIDAKKVFQITLEVFFITFVYVAYCFYFFYGTWYLNIFVLLSGLIFGYTYIDIRIELIENKFKNEFTRATRKLRYYLIHTKNITKAVEKTIDKAPESAKGYFRELLSSLNSYDVKAACDELKIRFPHDWLKMLSNLMYYCKINGDNEKSVSKNLSKLTNIIEFQNLQQGYDNVELLGAQIFVFVLPIIGIPLVQSVNSVFMNAVEQPNIYAMQEANIEAAKILFVANIGTLFLSWLRKNS